MVNHFPIYLNIYIYIPQQKTLTLKTDIYMQSGNSAILYVTVMLNDALLLFFTPSLSIHLLSLFIFLLCFVLSCMCESHIFLPKKC